LLAAGFDGPIFPINPKHDTVAGRRCFHSIAETDAGSRGDCHAGRHGAGNHP
jgi:hypothetical protein